jgi:hypothetical protein
MRFDFTQLALNKWGKKIVKGEQKIMLKQWKHRDGETKSSVITGNLLNSITFYIENDQLIIDYDVPYAYYVDQGRTYNNGYHFKGIRYTKAEEITSTDEFKHDLQKAFLRDYIASVHSEQRKK